MNLYGILGLLEENKFDGLDKFSEFAKNYLDFIASGGLQADIISRNETNYHFFQYREEGHFAIFLNDVQRKGKNPNYGVNSTFLPGHFCAYSIALNPLNGVYYFDLRPNMADGGFMSSHIKEFDSFIIEDMWELLEE